MSIAQYNTYAPSFDDVNVNCNSLLNCCNFAHFAHSHTVHALVIAEGATCIECNVAPVCRFSCPVCCVNTIAQLFRHNKGAVCCCCCCPCSSRCWRHARVMVAALQGALLHRAGAACGSGRIWVVTLFVKALSCCVGIQARQRTSNMSSGHRGMMSRTPGQGRCAGQTGVARGVGSAASTCPEPLAAPTAP